eukprot:TRINITY_DN7097_c0_g1_i1.p1 TRINITY_DN7097_c0_g1~~TRINITY_DN7097_c0_g1_i1.p1  ORF type:complete len:216 (-),score=38.68 TRINITY_DN7097_c0_g1_i1:28-675(-)
MLSTTHLLRIRPISQRNAIHARSYQTGPHLHSHLYADSEKKEIFDRIIRVDHAGELGAQRIYEGQLAILGKTEVGPIIQEMQDQETHHLQTFENLIRERRVRPTALMPIWNAIGYAAGAGSALLGKEAAMALTVAVEDVIGNHYNDQIRELNDKGYNLSEEDKKLKDTIREFRDDELGHLDIGLKHDAEKAILYSIYTNAIKMGVRSAIWLSTRV